MQNVAPQFHSATQRTLLLFTVLGSLSSLAAVSAAPAPQFSATLGIKETFDSNVYMQSTGPKADQSSLLTTLQASGALVWKPSDNLTLNGSYAPEFTVFHSASDENFAAHRFAAAASGKINDTKWDITNSLLVLDGENDSPTFTGAGGAPALGGVPLRDRRDAIVYRGAAKATVPLATGFVRPVVSFYDHDFHTTQSTKAGYQNYVDRSDFSAGVDLGYPLTQSLNLVGGYRRGQQGAGRAPGVLIDYANTYDRFLLGLEGTLGAKLKLSVLAGPDWRDFTSTTPAAFDQDATRFFIDLGATVTLSSTDTVTLTTRSFEQPGYGGNSLYIDTTYEAVWRHTFSPQWSLAATARALNWDFRVPARRNEWWYAGVLNLTWKQSKTLTLDASYSYDDIESRVSATSGREARRHLVSASVKRSF